MSKTFQPLGLLALVGGIALLPGQGRAAQDGWQLLAFSGQRVWQVAVDPLNDQTLYAVAENAGVVKSIDGGQTWRKLRDFQSPDGARIFLDSRLPAVLRLTDHEYVRGHVGYVSTDDGATWSEYPYFQALDATDARTLYRYGGPILYKSTDDGATWATIRADPDGRNCGSFALVGQYSLFGGNEPVIHVYAYNCGPTPDPRLFSSYNGGNTWSERDPRSLPGIGDQSYRSPNVIVGLTNGNILWSSNDYGRTWARVQTAPGLEPYVYGILWSRAYPTRLFAQAFPSMFVFESLDAGTSFFPMPGPVTNEVNQIEPTYGQPERLYVATSGGLYVRSTYDQNPLAHKQYFPEIYQASVALGGLP